MAPQGEGSKAATQDKTRVQEVSESMFTPDILACVGLAVFPDLYALYFREETVV